MAETTTLGELLASVGGSIKTGPFGTALKASEYTSAGVPVISVGEIGYGSIRVHAGTPRVDETVLGRLPEYVLREGDIIFGRKGAVDRSAWVKPNEDGYFLGSDGIRIRVGSGVSSRFLAYQLQSAATKQWLLQHASGTTMLSLNQKTLERVVVRVPTLSEQQAIAEVLGALDDKIAVNRRVSRTLRNLSVAHFQLVTKEAGYSVTLRDVSALITRGVTPKYQDSGMLVLNQKCIRDQSVNLIPARSMTPLTNKYDRILAKDDVLVNSTGQGTLGRIARWTHQSEATVDTHITIVRFDREKIDPVCAGFALVQLEKLVEDLAEGSTGQTELRRELLASMEIRVPAIQHQKALGEELDMFDSMELALTEENQILANTRDELLPLLMSGKLRVKDAEKKVEAIA